eukprot:2473146-Pleurochrysis_carterae.AAC.2
MYLSIQSTFLSRAVPAPCYSVKQPCDSRKSVSGAAGQSQLVSAAPHALSHKTVRVSERTISFTQSWQTGNNSCLRICEFAIMRSLETPTNHDRVNASRWQNIAGGRARACV